MPKILNTRSIYYNDCNLIAQPTHVDLKSRTDIPMALNRIFVSPMAAVVGKTFIEEATDIGLSVGIHRFCDIATQIEMVKCSTHDFKNTYVSIGLNDWDRVHLLRDYTYNWIIDCANGYMSKQILEVISKLKSKASIRNLVIGNIHSKEGIEIYNSLLNEPFKVYFRVGIACGCFIPEETVQTISGNKKIKDVEIGDKVKTHTGEYCNVINKFTYIKNEELMKINDITCTKNHEFYVVHKSNKNKVNENNIHQFATWISAEKLTSDYFLIEM